jgi:hypothetical protein
MGTTESVFSEEPSLSSSTTENPPPHPAVDVQLQQQILRQPPAPPLARGTTRTSEVSAVGRRSFSAASPAATSTSATTTATTTTQRSPPHSVFRLQGLVLGLEYSGKRTLLQRFEGKDPFSSSSSSTSTPRKTEILVPYKAPSPAAGAAAALQQQSHQTVASATTTSTGAVVWDYRIQLHVRAATDVPTDEVVGSAARCSQQDKKGISSSSSSSSCSSGLDFAVLLLNPRQTQQHQQTKASSHSHGRGKEKKHPKRHRKLVKQHLESTIRSLLHLQGYTRQQNEQQLDEEGESSSSLPKTRRPLCLSILLNFRDLMGDDDGGNDEHFLQESDVTSLTMQVLQDYAHQLDSQQMVLQCSTISLQNCYGLGLLHYFIYQSYLQRKRHDTEVLLRSVRSLQHEAQLHAQSLLVSYSDFVAHTAANITPEQHAARKIKQQHQRAVEQQQQPAPSHSTSKRDETISSSRISTTKEGEMKSLDSVDEDDHDNHNVDIQLPNDRRRRVMPEPPPTQATKQQTKDALEAFLGSSSDEEDIVESVGKLQGNRIVGNRRAIQADTSDDDDDFFVEKESSQEESNVEIAPTRRDGQYTALPTQQQQQQYERRTAAVAHERIKHDDSHAVASRSTERQQSAPPQLLQHKRDVAEKEQHAASVDQGSNIPAPPLLSQEEKRRSHRSTTGNIVGTNPAYVEPTASRAASSSLTGNSTSDLEDEGATIKQQENNGVKNAHPAATTPAALLQQRQEPIESTPAPPPSSTSAEVSPTIQSLAPNDETTRQEVHREQSLPNSNETTATLSDAEHEDKNNMHASRSSPEGKCDSVALNKNRKSGLERSERETSEDTLDLRSDESLLAGSAATTDTQTGASMVADDESPHKTPVQLSINQQDDTDDDDDDDDSHFFIGSSTKRNDSSDADGDDDEFFISSSRYSNAAQAPPTIANHKASPPDSTTTTPPVGGIGNSSSTSSGSGGLSAEAREAIAKAQEAFERELYSSAIPEFSRSANQLGPVACDAAPLGSTGTIPIEQSDAGASSTSTGEGSKNHHKKEKKKKKEVKEKKKAEKKERKKVKHNGNV